MDKPISMSVKDYLVRILAVKMLTNEHVLEAVINHQFLSSLEALKKENMVELSGFGKFCFNQKKANKKYEKALSKVVYFNEQFSLSTSEAKRQSYINKLNSTFATIQFLKPRVNEISTDLRRMEEQAFSLFGDEGTYINSVS